MAVLPLVLLTAEVASPESRPGASCSIATGPSGVVVEVIDGETLRLADGREVRLIGALTRVGPPSAKLDGQAEAALGELARGKAVSLAFPSGPARVDRHGRQLAHAFVEGSEGRVWLQDYLLSHGYAVAYGLPGRFGCWKELRAGERMARARGAGIWSGTAFRVRSAEQPRELLRLRNSYQIVMGTVQRVTVSRNRVYVDFGSDWREDFTAGLALNGRLEGGEVTKRLQAFVGRRVEARGWVERRFGPYIEIWDERQIEPVDAPGQGSP